MAFLLAKFQSLIRVETGTLTDVPMEIDSVWVPRETKVPDD